MGTAKYFKPQSIGDLDQKQKKAMTEEEVKHFLTSVDDNRQAIGQEIFEEPIAPPGLIKLEEPRDQRTDKRVSLPEDVLTKKVLKLFEEEKRVWTIEELS